MEQSARSAQQNAGGTGGTGSEASATIGIAFNLPEAMPYIGCLRRTICHLLKAVGASQDEIDDLETVIGELATNAARHAKGGNYHVSFEMYGDQAVVTVTDNGIGFDPANVLEVGSLRPDDLSDDDLPRIGGFGLSLAQSLADDFIIERNQPTGMVVQAKKKVRSIGERATFLCNNGTTNEQ